jgi:hypothetical protein
MKIRTPGMKAFHIVCIVNICGRSGRDGDNLLGCSEVTSADFTLHGAAVTEVAYQALLEHLQEEIRCQRSLTSCVLLLQDDARPHTVILDTCLHSERVPHPPYSSDLTPSDSQLFGKPKNHLLGPEGAWRVARLLLSTVLGNFYCMYKK